MMNFWKSDSDANKVKAAGAQSPTAEIPHEVARSSAREEEPRLPRIPDLLPDPKQIWW